MPEISLTFFVVAGVVIFVGCMALSIIDARAGKRVHK